MVIIASSAETASMLTVLRDDWGCETGCRTGVGVGVCDDDDDDDDGLEVGFGVDVGTMSSGFCIYRSQSSWASGVEMSVAFTCTWVESN